MLTKLLIHSLGEEVEKLNRQIKDEVAVKVRNQVWHQVLNPGREQLLYEVWPQIMDQIDKDIEDAYQVNA